MSKDVRVRVMDDNLHESLKIEAIKQKISLQDLIVKILSEYIKR